MEIDNKTTKVVKILFSVMLAVVFLYMLLGQLFLPSELGRDHYVYEVFESQWYHVLPDGSKREFSIPGDCDAKPNEVVVLETIIPEGVEDNHYLVFWNQRMDMEFYIDGELRGSYTTEDSRLFGKTGPVAYVFFELKESDIGKPARLVTQSDSASSGVFHTAYYGDKMGVWMANLKEGGSEITIALMMAIMGGICILTSVVLQRVYNRKIYMLYLGWGVFIAAMWLLMNSRLRQLIFPNLSVTSDMAFLMVMLLPIPFLIYMNDVQRGRYKRYYQIVEWISVINFVICFALAITEIRGFTDTFYSMALVGVMTVGLIVTAMIMDGIRGYIKEYKLLAIGMVVAGVAFIIQIGLYFAKEKIPFRGTMVASGLVFMLILAFIKTIQDLMLEERNKEKAIMENAAKGQFLANMSHEIRTPINAILGMDEMILRESTEKNVREYAEDIESAGKTLLSLINDILDFSKIESGKMEIVPGEYDVLDLLNDTYNMVAMRAESKGLNLQFEHDNKIPRRLYGDEVRLRQIMMNLLTNAIKYTDEGEVTLSMNWEPVDAKTMLMKIIVKDTGRGISKTDQKKMFNSFERFDMGNNRKVEGVGLGLNITRQLLDLMAGSIRVESALGKGSTFTVVIPQTIVIDTPIGDVDIMQTTEEIPVGEYQPKFIAPKAHILIVDDVPINLKVMQGLLKKTKICVDVAESGIQCLDMVKEKQYEMIFMDHMMPKMDGIETFCRLKAENVDILSHTPVIMLTANAIVGVKEKYLEEGFTDYLSKPVKSEQLEEILLKYLPKNLLEEYTEEETESVTDTTDQEDFLENIFFLNTDQGMLFCGGNIDFYKEILQMFAQNDKTELISHDYEEKNMESYRIQIHALKGTARSIGADDVVIVVEKIEAAIREKRESDVDKYHKQLMEKYEKLLKRLEKCV